METQTAAAPVEVLAGKLASVDQTPEALDSLKKECDQSAAEATENGASVLRPETPAKVNSLRLGKDACTSALR